MKRQPMQPVIIDERGTARFQANAIVSHIIDAKLIDMNTISMLAATKGFSKDDRMQFAQLIGYSVDGFGELSYTTDAVYAKAAAAAERARKAKRKAA